MDNLHFARFNDIESITNFSFPKNVFPFLEMGMLELFGSLDLNLGDVAREQKLHHPIDGHSGFTA